jgi:hypothetical protein
MEELVKLVSQKTGISEDLARTAVRTVVDYLKQKLPPPVAGQVDSILSGGAAGGLGDVAKGLGGMLGNR